MDKGEDKVDHVGRHIATKYVTGRNHATELELRQLIYAGKCELCDTWVEKGADAIGVRPGQQGNLGNKWKWFCLPCMNSKTTPDDVVAVRIEESVLGLFKGRSTTEETAAPKVTDSPFMRTRPVKLDDAA